MEIEPLSEEYQAVLDLNAKHHKYISGMLDAIDWLHEHELFVGEWIKDEEFHRPLPRTFNRLEIQKKMMADVGIDYDLWQKALDALLERQRELNDTQTSPPSTPPEPPSEGEPAPGRQEGT